LDIPKFQGDSLPHDSHAVDRVYQGLSFGFQNVADQDFHVSLLEKYITPDTNGQSNIQLLKLLQCHFVRYDKKTTTLVRRSRPFFNKLINGLPSAKVKVTYTEVGPT
jgi:hypothetical protein